MVDFQKHARDINKKLENNQGKQRSQFSFLSLLSPFRVFRVLRTKGIAFLFLILSALAGGIFCIYSWAWPHNVGDMFPEGFLVLLGGIVAFALFVTGVVNIAYDPVHFYKTKKPKTNKLSVRAENFNNSTEFSFVYKDEVIHCFDASHKDHDEFMDLVVDIDDFVEEANKRMRGTYRANFENKHVVQKVLRNSKNVFVKPNNQKLPEGLMDASFFGGIALSLIVLVVGVVVNRVSSPQAFDPKPTMQKVEATYAKGMPTFADFKNRVEAWSKSDQKIKGLNKVMFSPEKDKFIVKFDIRHNQDKVYEVSFVNGALKVDKTDPYAYDEDFGEL